MMIPDYEPYMLSSDGSGYSVVFYGQMTEDTRDQLLGKKEITNAVRLLRNFYDDNFKKNRLKFIPILVGKNTIIPFWALSYNGKPIDD